MYVILKYRTAKKLAKILRSKVVYFRLADRRVLAKRLATNIQFTFCYKAAPTATSEPTTVMFMRASRWGWFRSADTKAWLMLTKSVEAPSVRASC